jgi:hypothetical protein
MGPDGNREGWHHPHIDATTGAVNETMSAGEMFHRTRRDPSDFSA